MQGYPKFLKSIDDFDCYEMSPDCQYKMLYRLCCSRCGTVTTFFDSRYSSIKTKNEEAEKMICMKCGHSGISGWNEEIKIGFVPRSNEPFTMQLNMFEE